MSTDYEAVCDVCRVRCHFGQRHGVAMYSIGYGRGDGTGSECVLRFVYEHAFCTFGGAAPGVRIVAAGTTQGYSEWEWDEGDPFPVPHR